MKRIHGGWFGAIVVLAAGQSAWAQAPAPGVNNYLGAPSVTSLYGNPAMNPYMNPYAMGLMPNNPNMLMYMYAGNQANGGIGSGVISGTRPAPGVAAGSQVQPMNNPNPSAAQSALTSRGLTPKSSNARGGKQAAMMPMASSVPGSGAARYFNGATNGVNGAARYYNRPTGRFQNNGR